MDLELAKNESSNETLTEEDIVHRFLVYYLLEIPVAIIIFAAIISNVTIILVIIKFQLFKANERNIYITNWCVANTLLLLITPRQFLHIFSINIESMLLMCILLDHVCIVINANLIFIAILTLHWYITTYYSQKCVYNCRKFSLFITCLTWFFLIFFSFISIVFCVLDIIMPLLEIILAFGYLLVLLLIILIHVMKCIKSKTSNVLVPKSNLVLKLVTSFLISWLPYFVNFVCHTNLKHKYLLFLINILTSANGYANSIVILFLLYRNDQMFRDCLRRLCKCNETSLEMDDNYGSNNIDTSNEKQVTSLI